MTGEEKEIFAVVIKDPEDTDNDGAAFDYDFKTKIECICPSCGKRHMMNFHWIGRGTPRKFCKSCRSSEGSEF